MTRTLSMVSCKNYNLNTNEGFVIFLTSKLITCFIGGFTLIMKPQSIAPFFKIGRAGNIFRAGPKNVRFFFVFFFFQTGSCPHPIMAVWKVRWGVFCIRLWESSLPFESITIFLGRNRDKPCVCVDWQISFDVQLQTPKYQMTFSNRRRRRRMSVEIYTFF